MKFFLPMTYVVRLTFQGFFLAIMSLSADTFYFALKCPETVKANKININKILSLTEKKKKTNSFLIQR